MGINVFTASGRCGKDMELRTTPNGKAIGSFSLPVESGWGENKKTSWVTCKMFGDRAQKLQQYITKGAQVTVTGNFVLEEWERDGVKNSMPCIIVNDIQLPPQQQGQQKSQGQWQQQQQQTNQMHQHSQQIPDFDDDLPF